ncbi:WS/DGAT domain-containing protein [Clostridium oryzae]|uniref:Condensation domain protein n=1 Tax=Clostridium oryzae TaxID=1450648 RepID=A0A1V4IEE7_9CLOT|nr:WS/DGAT domain-containing protein [Clostridium oryzae]OPJ58306.1 condensation domain protein [Clostridium oryzae]
MKNRYKAEACDILQFIFSKFNDHQLHCVIDFDQLIDEKILKKAVEESLTIFPLIKCRFVEGWFKAYWEEDTFLVDDIVKIVRTEDIEIETNKLLISRTNEIKGPQLVLNIIRDGKRDCLCMVINHMLCDGAGIKEYVYMLSSIYTDLKQNKNCDIYKETGTRGLEQVFKSFSFADRIKILFHSAKFTKYDSGVTFKIEGDVNSPAVITYRISKDKFLTIKNYAKKYNATINDVMLAAYIRTLDKALDCGGITIPCAIDLRKYLKDRKAEGICNLASNIIFDIGPDIGKNYNETLLKVKEAMDEEKKNVSCLKTLMLLQIVFKYCPYKIAKKLLMKQYKNPPIAMTNIGLIDKNRLVFDGLHIRNSYVSASIKYKPYFQIGITTFDDEVTFCVNLHCTEKDKYKIKEFLKNMEKELLQAVKDYI